MENEPGMCNGECNSSDRNHGSFKDHVCDFVVGEMAVKSLGKFSDSEDGADVDCEGCGDETY